MKHLIRTCILLWIVLFALSLSPDPAAAHGTDYRILDSEGAIVVEFIYDDNQPMRYAEVLIFSPEDDDIEYQNGRTDMNGRFAIYPDAPGKWRIQADDGTGHLERVSIEVAADDTGEDTGEEGVSSVSERTTAQGRDHHHNGLPRIWAVILGISLIMNLFFGLYHFKGRK